MRAAVTSERKSAANRRNARASTGPKTAAGKARVARNARRHGLNVPIAADPALAREVEVLAQAICRSFGGGGSFFSLPPCGGGSGWGVGRFWHQVATSHDPHPRPLPTRGRGEANDGASYAIALAWGERQSHQNRTGTNLSV